MHNSQDPVRSFVSERRDAIFALWAYSSSIELIKTQTTSNEKGRSSLLQGHGTEGHGKAQHKDAKGIQGLCKLALRHRCLVLRRLTEQLLNFCAKTPTEIGLWLTAQGENKIIRSKARSMLRRTRHRQETHGATLHTLQDSGSSPRSSKRRESTATSSCRSLRTSSGTTSACRTYRRRRF